MTELIDAIVSQACEDFIEGFKALSKKYGSEFMKPGFAVLVPGSGDRNGVCKYRVASTGEALNKNLCLYFDALDFFRSKLFVQLTEMDSGAFIDRLTAKAVSETRARRPRSGKSDSREVA